MVEEMVNEPAVMGDDVTSDDKLWALLSWIIWPIGVIVLFLEEKKGRPFIKYNAAQSVLLGIVAWASTFIVIGVCLAPLAFFYAIYLGIQAYQGEWVEVPVVTDFCKNQGWV